MNLEHTEKSMAARREQWFAATRSRIDEVVQASGEGRIVQFGAPWREPVWILSALYTGSQEMIDLANRMVEQYARNNNENGGRRGMDYNIFISNSFAHCLHRFEKLLTPAARDVMTWHTQQVFKTYKGAAQPDFKFHGANDNMPMMATKGLILGGEVLDNRGAIAHGVWNLNQLRRLLSRSAWLSEFNSSTYSAVTLSALAKIVTFSADASIRQLALDIEHRLWAEILLHYHPGTMHQAGPQSRAYCIDYAGHNHSLQLMLWMAFGPQITGRDLIASYFHPEGKEVLHFAGNPWQTIAEFCEMLDTDLHVPSSLTHLITDRKYPATLRGRSECMGRYDGRSGIYHTETYMEEAFSLGTVDGPLCGGEQTASLYLTYQRKPGVKNFRDASTVFFKYLTSNMKIGEMEKSADGGHQGEKFVSHQGWCYALQEKNVGLLLCTPNLKKEPLTTDTLKLDVIFPAHFGRITRSVIGAMPVREEASGESKEVVPVSVEAGEVFIHVQPLLPTNLLRETAVRFVRSEQYEILEMINYQGPSRTFAREDLKRVLNGMVFTVSAKKQFASLEAFHKTMSSAVITDYLVFDHRFVLFQRKDVELEVVYTPDPFGIQTESINGRSVECPIFESNQIDIATLPFMRGPVPRNAPLFPWGDSLEASPFDKSSWIIGSRGVLEELNYSRRVEAIK